MNVLSLCDGMSCGQIALNELGIKIDNYYASEIKDIAIKVTKDNFPNTIFLGDVNNIHYKDGILSSDNGEYNVDNIDLVMFGSPCITGESLILTKEGYKKLLDVKINDYVLSHDNKYHKIINIWDKGEKEVFNISGHCFDSIKATKNHKFLVRKKIQVRNFKTNGYIRSFESPIWINLEELIGKEKEYYLGTAINRESKIPKWNGVELNKTHGGTYVKNTLNMEDSNLWYLVGRYIGDGWLKKNYKSTKNTRPYCGVIICCGKTEKEEFINKISSDYKYNIVEDRTTYKFTFSNTELASFLSQFGSGAKNKFLPGFIFDLPIVLLKSFLEGYFDADGFKDENKGIINFSTISKKLAYGIAQCAMKVYQMPCSIIMHKTKDKTVIEGRLVNQNDYYTGSIKFKKTGKEHCFYEDGYVWYNIKRIEKLEKKERVYDIEVEESHSFIANNCIVHNCQSFSIAMKKEFRVGLEDKEKSGLFLECYRVLKEVNPKFFLMENVASMKEDDRNFISKCLGVEPIRINSKVVAPALRDRLYWTNIPINTKLEPKKINLQDILTEGYTNRDKARCLLASQANSNKPNKMIHRFFAIRMTTIIFKDEEHYNKCKNWFDSMTEKLGRRLKASDFDDINEEFFEGVRYLNQTELERCQTVPEGYTKCLTYNQAANVLGDGWTIEVIKYILGGLK